MVRVRYTAEEGQVPCHPRAVADGERRGHLNKTVIPPLAPVLSEIP